MTHTQQWFDAKSLLSVIASYCVQFISFENTNIAPMSNLIQQEKVIQVQLGWERELRRHLKSQMNIQTLWCPYMDTD